MSKRVLNIYQYNPDVAFETPSGISMTVPMQGTSLKDLVMRAMAGARLPDVQFPIEEGEDETFEDAMDSDYDLSEIHESKSFLQRYSEAVEKAKKANEAQKQAKLADVAPSTPSDPLEKESV